jgi:hypothetical protein
VVTLNQPPVLAKWGNSERDHRKWTKVDKAARLHLEHSMQIMISNIDILHVTIYTKHHDNARRHVHSGSRPRTTGILLSTHTQLYPHRPSHQRNSPDCIGKTGLSSNSSNSSPSYFVSFVCCVLTEFGAVRFRSNHGSGLVSSASPFDEVSFVAASTRSFLRMMRVRERISTYVLYRTISRRRY